MKTRGFNVVYSRNLTIVISGNGYDPDKKELNQLMTPAISAATVRVYMDREMGRGLDWQAYLGKVEE